MEKQMVADRPNKASGTNEFINRDKWRFDPRHHATWAMGRGLADSAIRSLPNSCADASLRRVRTNSVGWPVCYQVGGVGFELS